MTVAKVIILTGASSGIGLAIALYLLQSSHKLVLLARRAAPLEKLKSKYPGQVEFIAADLSDFSVGSRAVALALEAFSRIDGVIINHGTLSPIKRISDSTADEWRSAFEVNFFSGVAIIQPALPSLRKARGCILLTSSGAAVGAYSTWGAYGSSKAALNHLALTLSAEEPDITTIAVRPGVVDTDMQNEVRSHGKVMDGSDAEKFKRLYEEGKLLRPDQPGNVMARLVLEAAKELSGQFLSWNDTALDNYQES